MKKYLIFCFILVASYCKAQTVSPDSAKYHKGSVITVCGKVMGTFTARSGKIFLNFGADHPNQTFTALIESSDAEKFKSDPAKYYKDKQVCVTGKIKMYNDKPEIFVTSPDQIKEK